MGAFKHTWFDSTKCCHLNKIPIEELPAKKIVNTYLYFCLCCWVLLWSGEIIPQSVQKLTLLGVSISFAPSQLLVAPLAVNHIFTGHGIDESINEKNYWLKQGTGKTPGNVAFQTDIMGQFIFIRAVYTSMDSKRSKYLKSATQACLFYVIITLMSKSNREYAKLNCHCCLSGTTHKGKGKISV